MAHPAKLVLHFKMLSLSEIQKHSLLPQIFYHSSVFPLYSSKNV